MPSLSVPFQMLVTNIDYEHLENYGGFGDLEQAFVEFANKVPFYGAVIACADDPHLAAVLPRITRRVITYGLNAPDCDVTARDEVWHRKYAEDEQGRPVPRAVPEVPSEPARLEVSGNGEAEELDVEEHAEEEAHEEHEPHIHMPTPDSVPNIKARR